MTSYVITLEPDEKLAGIVANHKRDVRLLVGDQRYLKDPAHSTMYIADLKDFKDWELKFDDLINELSFMLTNQIIALNGWFVFENDLVTKNHTLVIEMDERTKDSLSMIQSKVVTLLKDYRVNKSISRYDDVSNYPEVFQKNVGYCGYPFVGDIWKPHISIASINTSDFPIVWSNLRSSNPIGKYGLGSIAIYELDETTENLTEIKRYEIVDELGGLKQKVYKSNILLKKLGLVSYTWGNVSSIDRDKNLVVIKPSGVSYKKMCAKDMVITDLDGNVINSRLKPSSDLLTHLEIYKAFPKINSIIHTHSKNATAFAQAKKSIRCIGTTHADNFYGDIPLVDFPSKDDTKEYEKSTGKMIARYFIDNDIDPLDIPGCIVSGHGPFAWGKSIKDALMNASVMEKVAEMNILSESLNSNISSIPNHILKKHFLRKHGDNAYYGQK